MPKDHLLCKIDRMIVSSATRVKICTAPTMVVAIDSVVRFKEPFLGYLFGFCSERQLVREIQVNDAYRGFAGFDLPDKISDPLIFYQSNRLNLKLIMKDAHETQSSGFMR